MSALVTLPGDIPGLLRRGAILRWEEATHRWLFTGQRPGGPCAVALTSGYHDAFVEPAWYHEFGLDLSEPAGRDIAVRWIAEKLGVETGLTAPMFDMSEHGVWVLTCGWGPLRRWFFHPDPDYGCGNTNWSAVPGLPKDRAQGIEALRLIVLHLAGRRS